MMKSSGCGKGMLLRTMLRLGVLVLQLLARPVLLLLCRQGLAAPQAPWTQQQRQHQQRQILQLRRSFQLPGCLHGRSRGCWLPVAAAAAAIRSSSGVGLPAVSVKVWRPTCGQHAD
jgi:hypothetical protein